MLNLTSEQLNLLAQPLKELGLSIGLQDHIKEVIGKDAKLKDLCIFAGNLLSYEGIRKKVVTEPLFIYIEAVKHIYKGKDLKEKLLESKKIGNTYQRYYNELIDYLKYYKFRFIESKKTKCKPTRKTI